MLRRISRLSEIRRRRPRFPSKGAGPLLALAAVVALVTAWSVRGHHEPPPHRPDPPIEQPASPPPPTPAPEPPKEPPPPEADGCPQGCASPRSGCDIKGNISLRKGERIYHLPGQRYYGKTVISPEKGERWFCTEEEAEENGWRKAKV
jgi:micrococcal nuclease